MEKGSFSYGNGSSITFAILTTLFTDDRGWWGDLVEGLRHGSSLYELERSKLSNEALARTKTKVSKALEFMISDGIVKSFTVTTSKLTNEMIRILIIVTHLDGRDENVPIDWKLNGN
jgi:phage gp46-like protein